MPEYLAPGVYTEEVQFRAGTIEGVSTSTTGFVGPTRTGPVSDTPELLTSFGDFERIYGGLENLEFGGSSVLNFMAHAVRAYFNEGGSRLYVSRVFQAAPPPEVEEGEEGEEGEAEAPAAEAVAADGIATSDPIFGDSEANQVTIVARFPGSTGNGTVTLRQVRTLASSQTMRTAPDGTLLQVGTDSPTIYLKQNGAWLDSNDDELGDSSEPMNFLSLTVLTEDGDGNTLTFEDLGFAAPHPRPIAEVLSPTPSRRSDFLQNPYAIALGSSVTAFSLQAGLFGSSDEVIVPVEGGNDGLMPNQAAYESALTELTTLEDISIVAAPGHSEYTDFQGIQGALVIHAEQRKSYRIAVLDTPSGQAVSEARAVKSRIDSTYAALYYPWVIVSNPLARAGVATIPTEIALPPSGFICGIYARNDIERGVFKAPANEVVRSALRFERTVNFAEQELLNPLGVNCLRFFPGRGYRVWGARTTSSDLLWKYVSTRRYFNYLEQSIDRSTQWVVFEPNGEQLWGNVRNTVAEFLYNEWLSGALLGSSPQEAFFVRCDRSTMTQNDLDNGRLICLIGVAVVKPAEFVIFRIGQKTAEARS